jgi:hypothetical protein
VSGGFFDYDQYKIMEHADTIRAEAVSKDFPYSRETQDKFLVACYHLTKARIYLNRIDWFLSGDDGEETFHQRLKEDLAKLDGGEVDEREYY